MKEEREYSSDQFHAVKRFLKDSWVQVPDKLSASRIMRPRFMARQHANYGKRKDDNDDKGKEDQKVEGRETETHQIEDHHTEQEPEGQEAGTRQPEDKVPRPPPNQDQHTEGKEKARFMDASAIYVS